MFFLALSARLVYSLGAFLLAPCSILLYSNCILWCFWFGDTHIKSARKFGKIVFHMMLLWFKDLMNITEMSQFIEPTNASKVLSGAFIRGENLYPLALCTGDRNLVLPSSKKLSFNLSSPHPGQYTNCTPSPGHPPFGWTQKLFFKFFRLLCVGNLKWSKYYVGVNHYSPRKEIYFNWNIN